MSQHTPGPWDGYCNNCKRPDLSSTVTLCKVHRSRCTKWRHTCQCGVMSAESLKDAADGFEHQAKRADRLQAINADLLAALQGMVAAFGLQLSKSPAVDRARAAIAKAKGERNGV